MEWKFEVSRCKLLHIGWINKVPLYGTQNHIQYSMINHNRKEFQKQTVCVCLHVCVCACVCNSRFCAAEMNTL